jgi:hypothetical protein
LFSSRKTIFRHDRVFTRNTHWRRRSISTVWPWLVSVWFMSSTSSFSSAMTFLGVISFYPSWGSRVTIAFSAWSGTRTTWFLATTVASFPRSGTTRWKGTLTTTRSLFTLIAILKLIKLWENKLQVSLAVAYLGSLHRRTLLNIKKIRQNNTYRSVNILGSFIDNNTKTFRLPVWSLRHISSNYMP